MQVPDKFFSSLEAVAAGFHNGRSHVLADGHISSKMIYAHELTHGRIFQESLDGVLHLCVLLALESQAFARAHTELAELNGFLFESTRDSHEKVAAYLGVQSLSSADEMAAAIRTLPGQYLDYYLFFDNLLMSLPSSYVRYSVAWASGRLAFSSGRTGSIDGQHLTTSVKSVEGPTERLDKIGAFLATLAPSKLSAFVRDCANRAFERGDYDQFDIMDDNEWEARLRHKHSKTQEFDTALLVELSSSLSQAIPMKQHEDLALDGYFAPIAPRFSQRKTALVVEADGTTDNYDHALELAAMADAMQISRLRVLKPQQYNKRRAFDWIEHHASKTVFISAVEIPERRGHYKLFLADGVGERSTYADGFPCIVTGADLSEIFLHLHSSCKKQSALIPPVFMFTEQAAPTEEEFAGLTTPPGSGWLFWRPGANLGPSKNPRCVPFYVRPTRWSGLIDRYKGTWTQVNTTIGVPQEGLQFSLAATFIFPRQKTWIPYIRFMTTMAASLYQPLLRTSSVKKKLRYRELSANGEIVLNAAMAVWETFEQH
ncbi:MAG: hypothetical protein ACT6U0_20590 [Shinella sp.]|uniref:hypothetical protein n=1 Tax=Shinella sp. TaxID=1870904 RepID=UPI00403604AB